MLLALNIAALQRTRCCGGKAWICHRVSTQGRGGGEVRGAPQAPQSEKASGFTLLRTCPACLHCASSLVAFSLLCSVPFPFKSDFCKLAYIFLPLSTFARYTSTY